VAFLENSVKLYLKLRMNQSYMPYDFRLLVVRTKSTFLSYTRHTIQVDIDWHVFTSIEFNLQWGNDFRM